MIDEQNIYHISPNNDTREHLLECTIEIDALDANMKCACECEPEFVEMNELLFIVHRSFDGREALDWTRDILDGNECDDNPDDCIT